MDFLVEEWFVVKLVFFVLGIESPEDSIVVEVFVLLIAINAVFVNILG